MGQAILPADWLFSQSSGLKGGRVPDWPPAKSSMTKSSRRAKKQEISSTVPVVFFEGWRYVRNHPSAGYPRSDLSRVGITAAEGRAEASLAAFTYAKLIQVEKDTNMRGITSSAALFAAVLGVVAVAPRAAADEHDKKTILTFDQAVEVPGGVVLQPGKYVFILQNSQNDRHIVLIKNVLIKNERANKTYAQVFATNAFHVKPRGKTQVLFWESPAGQPEILRAWFYPGDNYGQSFMYKKDRAVEIKRAQKSGDEVPVEEDAQGAGDARK